MSFAVRVENLSKSYRIGRQGRGGPAYRTLREEIVRAVRSPLAAFSKQPGASAEEFWALRDVSFDVAPGGVLGVIGRNGAGKSTLLKVLSRITEPTSGRVRLRGRVGSLLEVGTGFHQELTGRENIFLAGAILGMSRTEVMRKFDEIVAFSEIEKFLDTPAKRYSSGMYMRLAFAVAAHLEPDIFVIDEVLAVGDAEFQKKCLGKMGEVARGGRTVLFVSHNMVAIQQLCNAVVLLEAGRVVRHSDDCAAVVKQYLVGSGEGSAGSWHARSDEPRNDYFAPQAFWIGDDHGQPISMPTDRKVPMWVYLDGRVLQTDPALNFGYALSTESGELLYWSLTTDSATESWPRIDAAPLRLRSRIPATLLNEGTFRLELIVSLHFRQWIYQPGVNAPSIDLAIQGRFSDSPYWMIRRPGLLGPELPWERCEP